LSSAIDGFKRVGLHYIAFLNTPIVKTRLPPFSTSKIAEFGRSVTNFGLALPKKIGDYLLTSLQPSHGDLAKNWSRRLDIDCAHDDTIPVLMLSYAARGNENWLVLVPLKRNSAHGPQPTRHHTFYPAVVIARLVGSYMRRRRS